MAALFVGSNLLAEAPRVTVRFEQEDGRTLSDIRRQFGQSDAELRELNTGERRQANRTNPDYRLVNGKEYELVVPGRKRGWSKDVCRNASQLVGFALNLPADFWERPADLVNSPLSILLLLVLRMCRLVIATWMFTMGLLSTGCTMPMQVTYHLFTIALRSIAPTFSDDLPALGHTPRYMFIAVSCFLSLLGTAFVFLLLLLSLLSQVYVCFLELIVRLLSWLIWVVMVCFGSDGLSGRKRIDLIFFLVSLPWLNGVVFMSREFLGRLTYLVATYFLMACRYRVSTTVGTRPVGSPEYRSSLLQYGLLWSFPSLSLVVAHFYSQPASLYVCWTLVCCSLAVPYLADRSSRRLSQ